MSFNPINLDYIFEEDDRISPWIEERENPLLDGVDNSKWLDLVSDDDGGGGNDSNGDGSDENDGGGTHRYQARRTSQSSTPTPTQSDNSGGLTPSDGGGDDGDGESTSHGDVGGGGSDNGGDGTSFGAGSEDFIGGFGLCDVGEHYDIGEPVAPLPQLPRRFRGSDTRRDERRIRSREQQLDSSDSSHSYPYHPYPSYSSDSQSYPYPPQQNYPWLPQQHGPPGYGLPNYQQAQQEYVDPFQPRVNVDDAVDDIVRQFKGVSDGLMRKVVGSSSPPHEVSPAISSRNLSFNAEMIKQLSWQNSTESAKSISDNDEGDKDGINEHEEVEPTVEASGWHSDNELNTKGFPPRVVKRGEEIRSLDPEKKHGSDRESPSVSLGGYPASGFPVSSDHLEDPVVAPPEWTTPNVSLPVLNLVDKMFQLKRKGWLRRQVFWISKQIWQLMMEDAIDDWLLGQIQWLWRDDVIAQGIQGIDWQCQVLVLWPDGTFFLRLNSHTEIDDCEPHQRSFQTTRSRASKLGSFEQQLEAARRASDTKKMIFNGAPTALVSLIGHKQYHRTARDTYYFLQSTICLKQLAYGILELVLVSVFPELRDLVLDIHQKMHTQAE
ncbi:unnamed protein product [Camellia sinensis]